MDATTPEAASSTAVCSQCGGANELPTGRRLITCAFCDTTLFLDRSAVVVHYRIPGLLARDEAEAALRRWMAGNETVKGLDRDARLENMVAISFPVWLFRTSDGGVEHVLVEPAAATPIPQVADLQIPAGRLEPYRAEPEEVETVEVGVPLETAQTWLEQRGAKHVVETALVRVPLWRAHYLHRGQSYAAVVDASTGQVLAADYPEKAESPYLLVAVLGLALFGLEGLLITDLSIKLLAYAVTALPLTLLAYWVARRV